MIELTDNEKAFLKFVCNHQIVAYEVNILTKDNLVSEQNYLAAKSLLEKLGA